MSDGYVTDEFGKFWTGEEWDHKMDNFIQHCDSLGIPNIES